MYEKKPWLQFYGDTPRSLDYPESTMYESVKKIAQAHPELSAYDFLGFSSSYEKLLKDIDAYAVAFSALGLKKGDTVTIALPNTPHAIISFYALNKLGVVASMIHPLSTASEITFYCELSKSRWIITLDAFYGKVREAVKDTPVEKILLGSIPDYLSGLKTLLFSATKGRKIAKVPEDPMVLWWKDLGKAEPPSVEKADFGPDEVAVILYSGGTTGKPKGIMLTSRNFNALSLQTSAQGGPLSPGDSILSILPVFHGFGLGVCVHTFLIIGGTCILVPTFTPRTVAKLIRQRKPQFMAGVPTLYAALSEDPHFKKADLSCFKGTFSGGDTLPRAIKERFEKVVRTQGGKVQLREGYGLTESVTANMLMPRDWYKEKSIGVPYPDMTAKVVRVGTTEEAKLGEEGEICISGPSVMVGYLEDPEETSKVLRKHRDGLIWLHTGDLGSMDEDGYFFFRQRLKRVIKSSGMSVYPTQVEEILDNHPDVAQSCVIGIPDKQQIHVLKAFVILNEPSKIGPEMEEKLIQHCRKHLIKWSCPRMVEFRTEFPKTLVGKVAYRTLEEEEMKKNAIKEEIAP
jgi:long-chain acyl-CoA synthetase